VALDHLGLYLEAGAILGRRTAELHLALATPTDDPAFAPEALTDVDLNAQFAGIRQHASSVLDMLKERLSYLPDEAVEVAASVLSRRRQILDRFAPLNGEFPPIQRIRIHGDYHLGQVLRVKTDFVILDFEGEPARPLAVRRSKQCPLKDVAGMLRSFGYAAYAGLMNYSARHPEDLTRLEPWAQLWERSAAAEFLRAYHQAAQGPDFLPPGKDDFRKLLNVFLLDKALYEVLYELNSRPAWVRIPLMGIMLLVP
jgi:maltose alpha-D-glucosyltransferase/alpha-amylase